METDKKKSKKDLKKNIILVFMSFFIIIFGGIILSNRKIILPKLDRYINAYPILGSFVYSFIIITLLILCLPIYIFLPLGGYIYSSIYGNLQGFSIAFLLSSISILIGSVISYFIGKNTTPIIQTSKFKKKVDYILKNYKISHHFILRCIPCPITIHNYIISNTTDISFFKYITGMVVYMPLMIAAIVFGVIANSVEDLV